MTVGGDDELSKAGEINRNSKFKKYFYLGVSLSRSLTDQVVFHVSARFFTHKV